MAVTARTTLQFQLMEGQIVSFNTGQMTSTVTTMTQQFAADVLVADQTTDREISLQGVGMGQQIYVLCDQPVLLKLLPQGAILANTVGYMMMPNVPSLLSVQNIVSIFVTNTTGTTARVIVQGAGVS